MSEKFKRSSKTLSNWQILLQPITLLHRSRMVRWQERHTTISVTWGVGKQRTEYERRRSKIWPRHLHHNLTGICDHFRCNRMSSVDYNYKHQDGFGLHAIRWVKVWLIHTPVRLFHSQLPVERMQVGEQAHFHLFPLMGSRGKYSRNIGEERDKIMEV